MVVVQRSSIVRPKGTGSEKTFLFQQKVSDLESILIVNYTDLHTNFILQNFYPHRCKKYYNNVEKSADGKVQLLVFSFLVESSSLPSLIPYLTTCTHLGEKVPAKIVPSFSRRLFNHSGILSVSIVRPLSKQLETHLVFPFLNIKVFFVDLFWTDSGFLRGAFLPVLSA